MQPEGAQKTSALLAQPSVEKKILYILADTQDKGNQ